MLTTDVLKNSSVKLDEKWQYNKINAADLD